MIISYEEFISMISEKVKESKELYDQILDNVIENPQRYCGLFRLSNAKNKLIQNLTQSREIKLGDLLEDMVTTYLESKVGFYNLDKKLSNTNHTQRYMADQLFKKDDNIYLVEQKIRDDHDSTKKRGQYENFEFKLELLKQQHVENNVVGIMWFIDDSLNKNSNYYRTKMNSKNDGISRYLFYGGELFNYLGIQDIWREIIDNLTLFRSNLDPNVIFIPDFGTSDEIYNALLRLSNAKWNKLTSNQEIYRKLREELFSGGNNLARARSNR